MSFPYYVEPEYWVEGYAEGDAKIAAATLACSLELAATVNLVLFSSAATSISAIFTASARLKWEPEPDTPETWSDVPSASGIWTDVPDTSETWTEVA